MGNSVCEAHSNKRKERAGLQCDHVLQNSPPCLHTRNGYHTTQVLEMSARSSANMPVALQRNSAAVGIAQCLHLGCVNVQREASRQACLAAWEMGSSSGDAEWRQCKLLQPAAACDNLLLHLANGLCCVCKGCTLQQLEDGRDRCTAKSAAAHARAWVERGKYHCHKQSAVLRKFNTSKKASRHNHMRCMGLSSIMHVTPAPLLAQHSHQHDPVPCCAYGQTDTRLCMWLATDPSHVPCQSCWPASYVGGLKEYASCCCGRCCCCSCCGAC